MNETLEKDSLRKIVHDLNGELFLIRGYAELTEPLVEEMPLAADHLRKILARSYELEKIIKKLKLKQLSLEPSQ